MGRITTSYVGKLTPSLDIQDFAVAPVEWTVNPKEGSEQIQVR
jgi:hypothetical protein